MVGKTAVVRIHKMSIMEMATKEMREGIREERRKGGNKKQRDK